MTTMRMWCLAVLGVVLMHLVGCATYEYAKPAPGPPQHATVEVAGDLFASSLDLPVGAYRIPDSQVIVTGQPKGLTAGILFGPLGVAIAHAANANTVAQSVQGAEAALRVPIGARLEAAVAQALRLPSLQDRFAIAPDKGSARLTLTPALVLCYVSDTHVHPFVVVKARLLGPDQRALWETRYLGSTGPSRPLTGSGSWVEADAAALGDSVQATADQIVEFLLDDLATPFPRDAAQRVAVEGPFPYLHSRMKFVGVKLTENARYVAVIPRLGDAGLLAGVHVVDKQIATIRPAGADEPILQAAKAD